MVGQEQKPASAGDVIGGRFRLEKPLGAGGMGEVWRATQMALGRAVALKLIRPEHARSSDAIRRFQSETAALATVQHPNVVQVIDGGNDDNGQLFLVMELLQGDTLRARLQADGLRLPAAVGIASEVCGALVATHAAGILHRDLKAENVFLSRAVGAEEHAKVLDFGISRLAQTDDPGLTPTGVLVGTPGYMAPEQMRGQPVDARADLYALGVMLFEMLSGALPFSGASTVELLMKHLTTPAPRVASVARARGIEVPAPLDDLVAALLAKAPEQRPASAAVLQAALRGLRGGQTPMPPAVSAPSAEAFTETDSGVRIADARPLLGRQQELQQLEAGIDEAAAGRGAMFFLVGEPGIGKTRLSDAFAESCARRGVDVIWGRAWEAGGAPAFFPWSEALDALVQSMRDPAPQDDVNWLAEIVPSLRARAQPAPMLEPTDARFRLFGAVGGLLRRATESKPLAIILDDIHAADAASLQLLLSVARDLRRRRIVILATYRDVEAELVPEVAELVGRLAREGRTLHLARLKDAEVGALASSHAGKLVPDDVARAIFNATHGNPLFVDEMVRLLSTQGRLDTLGEGPLPVPLGVREAIRQRLGRASPATRAALEVIAVLGREVRAQAAAAVLGAPVEDAIREGTRFGVLARGERGAARFTHALYREELYNELPEQRRQELHAKAAAALAAAVDPPLVDIAAHLLAAGPAHQSRAVDAALATAESLVDALAFEDAAALVQRVLDEATALDDRRRGDALVLLGRAVLLSGDVRRAHELCLRAANIARQQADPELFARAALGYGARLVETSVDLTLVQLLREAVEMLSSVPVWRARVMARLAAAEQPAADMWKPVAMAKQAFEIARSFNDERARLAVLHDGMGALMSVELPANREPINQEILALAERLGDGAKQLRTRFRLILDATEKYALDRALALLAQYRDAATSLRARDAQWRASLLGAMFSESRCDHAQAEALLAESAAFGAPESVLGAHRYQMGWLWQRPDLAAPWIAQLHAAFDRISPLVAAALDARELAMRGDAEGTRRILDRMELEGPLPFFISMWLSVPFSLCRLGAHCADTSAKLEPWSTMLSVETGSFSITEPTALLLALLADGRGDGDASRRLIRQAVHRARDPGLLTFLPRTLVEAGRVLAGGSADDRREAGVVLAEARTLMTSLDQPGLLPFVARADAAQRA